jgi:hypothetical protein
LAGSSQVEDNKVIEQNTKDIELRSRTKVQDVAIIPNNITSNIVETTTVELDQEKEQLQTESVRDLKATIEHQAQYINTLEDKIQEKQEIQKLQGQLRIKISISQLYRDVLMMRNSGVTYTHIIIDNDKYIKLEGI